MTTEVVVLNRFGVAIAADSAATVAHIHQNERKQKVYNSANKLFALSKYAPVGIVIFQSGALGGLPWETIVKSYRKHLGRTVYDTLDQYCDDLFRWIESTPGLFDDAYVDAAIAEAAVTILNNLGSGTPEEYGKRLSKRLTQQHSRAFIDGFDQSLMDELKVVHSKPIRDLVAQLPEDYRAGREEDLFNYVAESLGRTGAKLNSYSGVVVCGFGEREFYPRAVEYRTELILLGRVRRARRKSYAISAETPSHIVPLADKEVIDTILDGISPSFSQAANTGAFELIASLPQTIISQIEELSQDRKDHYINAAHPLVSTYLMRYLQGMSKFREDHYSAPVKSVIASLPVSELGVVAETFLSVAQMHKKINPGAETVGGPVDVAVISKGDGFIWIRRKHYFDRDLNPTFVARYFDP
ncbi:MAG: hypothetical protein KIS96_08960 [Bauldia sp.]|nr:hypothetical protein [Bauldia sp.]